MTIETYQHQCSACSREISRSAMSYHHGILVATCPHCLRQGDVRTDGEPVDWVIYEHAPAMALLAYRGDEARLGRGYATREQAEDRARTVRVHAAAAGRGADPRVAPRYRMATAAHEPAPTGWRPYRAVVGDVTPHYATVIRVLPIRCRDDVRHRPDQRMVASDRSMAVGDRVRLTSGEGYTSTDIAEIVG